MRVLFATFAEKTHFIGMAPLGWALRTAGHDVRVASQPELAGIIADTGLTAVPVGRDHLLSQVLQWTRRLGPDQAPGFDLMENRPEVLTWDHLRRGYRDVLLPLWWKVINESMIDDLTEFCLSWRPDLVIWEPLTFAAPIAARACGAAHGRLPFALDLTARMRGHYLRVMGEQPPQERDDVLARWLGARVARFGGEFAEELAVGQFTIDYLPPSLRLDVDVRHVPMRYVPYNGRAIVPGWLRVPPERPRVCLSLGTSATDRLGAYAVSVQDLLDGLAELDVEVVATLPAGQRAGLGRVPDNARIVGYTPLHDLMPTCAAMINHGGAGTVLTALASGVPQLVVPHHMFDEPLLARRLAEAEAGVTIEPAEVSGDSVRKQVLRLLDDPSMGAGARALREEMSAMPSPNEIVRELEELAHGPREAAGQTTLTSGV
ncbi:activator-dependent family glycosyltransferase [Nonomuraea sp. SYSU D8015]|uniref:activator-dependent family glycosyltransferase n=1 Tax=Nonomuraea sp. SYSU D8015 TaxID=2593644 RepID=UPI001660A95D|nr:activator-dependent family glycosyltransferase [Nonomuraea sp. SYSU D8015]